MPHTNRATLNTYEQDELHRWLKTHNINPAHIRREFTDVVPIARLLAKHYPEIVDPNYYMPRNSVQSKVSNWILFNKRVLHRLGVRMTREDIEHVARSTPGVIDMLLYRIMRLHNCQKFLHEMTTANEQNVGAAISESANMDNDIKRENRGVSSAEQKHHSVSDVIVVNMPQQTRDSIVMQSKKMIAFNLYAQAVHDLNNKYENIKKIQQKLAHLENMAHLKSERIEELHCEIIDKQIKQRPRIPSPPAVILNLAKTLPVFRAGVGEYGSGASKVSTNYRNANVMQRAKKILTTTKTNQLKTSKSYVRATRPALVLRMTTSPKSMTATAAAEGLTINERHKNEELILTMHNNKNNNNNKQKNACCSSIRKKLNIRKRLSRKLSIGCSALAS